MKFPWEHSRLFALSVCSIFYLNRYPGSLLKHRDDTRVMWSTVIKWQSRGTCTSLSLTVREPTTLSLSSTCSPKMLCKLNSLIQVRRCFHQHHSTSLWSQTKVSSANCVFVWNGINENQINRFNLDRFHSGFAARSHFNLQPWLGFSTPCSLFFAE